MEVYEAKRFYSLYKNEPDILERIQNVVKRHPWTLHHIAKSIRSKEHQRMIYDAFDWSVDLDNPVYITALQIDNDDILFSYPDYRRKLDCYDEFPEKIKKAILRKFTGSEDRYGLLTYKNAIRECWVFLADHLEVPEMTQLLIHFGTFYKFIRRLQNYKGNLRDVIKGCEDNNKEYSSLVEYYLEDNLDQVENYLDLHQYFGDKAIIKAIEEGHWDNDLDLVRSKIIKRPYHDIFSAGLDRLFPHQIPRDFLDYLDGHPKANHLFSLCYERALEYGLSEDLEALLDMAHKFDNIALYENSKKSELLFKRIGTNKIDYNFRSSWEISGWGYDSIAILAKNFYNFNGIISSLDDNEIIDIYNNVDLEYNIRTRIINNYLEPGNLRYLNYVSEDLDQLIKRKSFQVVHKSLQDVFIEVVHYDQDFNEVKESLCMECYSFNVQEEHILYHKVNPIISPCSKCGKR